MPDGGTDPGADDAGEDIDAPEMSGVDVAVGVDGVDADDVSAAPLVMADRFCCDADCGDGTAVRVADCLC